MLLKLLFLYFVKFSGSCCNNVLSIVFQMLGQFIARAIADHILPMSFLDCYKGKVDCEHAR